MIYIGLSDAVKTSVFERYLADHSDVRKVFVLSPERFAPGFAPERMTDPTTQGDGRRGLFIDYPDIIRYRYFYRLVQEVDASTLVVIHECLRTQNRNDLTYNCIRHFLNQTTHQLVFQRLPLIDTVEDFGVLFDFDTRSRWKRTPFAQLSLGEARIEVEPVTPAFRVVPVETDAKTKATYAKEKRKLIDGIGNRDPHTIPRNLYLVGGAAKRQAMEPGRRYVARGNRWDLPNVTTYRADAHPDAPYVVAEFPHGFLDFSDFIASSGQTAFDVLTADLKVDAWYLDRYTAWAGRVHDACAALHR